MSNPEPSDADLIRDQLARGERIWLAMLDEPQDPQTAAIIAARGPRNPDRREED